MPPLPVIRWWNGPLRQTSCRLKFSILGVESEDNVKDEQENLYGRIQGPSGCEGVSATERRRYQRGGRALADKPGYFEGLDTGGDPGAEALVAEPDAGGSFFTGRPVAGAARDPWDERESPAGLVSAARRICAGFGALGEAFWTPGGRQARQQETVALRELRLAQVQLQREMNRKNKALAEAASLRVLPKKFQALWAAEDA